MAVFNQISRSFDAGSFLANVGESSSRYGLQYLQRSLVSDLRAPQSSASISDTDGGIKTLQAIRRSRKLLIILDNVTEKEQIESLAGSSSWFGPSSRIIVTTRDIRELENRERLEEASGSGNSTRVRTMEIKEMDFHQALQLFSLLAFKTVSPPDDYRVISTEVVRSIWRLPLVLEAIGAHLHGKDMEQWEEKRRTLAKISKKDIQKMLMLSYQGLDFRTKQIFLDVACLPPNLGKASAFCMWRSCGFRPEIGIEVLLSLSLIKVVDNDILWMHDHVRGLGREIVSMENFMDLGQRSRLWDCKEAFDILGRKQVNGD